jgi:uncharacterized damage-inducible protein DinB
MVTRPVLAFLYDYHYWITPQLLDACEALSPEQWVRPLGHSWGSVHAVAAHMLAAETIWLRRWLGESPRALRQPAELPALADVRREWAALEREVRGFLAEVDDARLAADFTYTNTRGQAFTLPLGQVMLHTANHATHHRGELVAMLAVLEVPHPEDDLLRYLIEKRPGSGPR